MLVVALLIAVVSIFGLAFAGLGVLLAVVGLRTLARAFRAWIGAFRSRNWQATTGRITRSLIVQESSGRHESFRPEIAYVYEVDGQSCSGTRVVFSSDLGHESRSDGEDWVKRFPRGAAATVFFEPGRPENSTLDRRRPSLFGSLAVFGACLLTAAFLVPVGIDIVVGAVTEPPSFSESELPPPRQQLGGLLLALGAVFTLITVIVALDGRRRRRLRLARLLQAAPLTQVADVREGELVAVFGRAEQGEAKATVSPVTRRPALYCRVRVVAENRNLFEDVSHGDFRLRDGTGRLLVLTEGGTDETLPSVVPNDPAVRQWVQESLEDSPLTIPAEFVVEQSLIAPDAPVLAIGRAERDPDTGQLYLQADPDDETSLVFSTEPRHELLRRLKQGSLRNTAFAVGAASALLAGVALLIG